TLSAQDIQFRRLTVSHAFHSPLMEPVLDEFERVAATITYHVPQITVISNVTGRPAAAEQLTSPGYWREHLRQAVQFATGIDSLHELGADTFLEIGPHPTLISMGQRCRPDLQALWL